jgi:hypothetical protein
MDTGTQRAQEQVALRAILFSVHEFERFQRYEVSLLTPKQRCVGKSKKRIKITNLKIFSFLFFCGSKIF